MSKSNETEGPVLGSTNPQPADIGGPANKPSDRAAAPADAEALQAQADAWRKVQEGNAVLSQYEKGLDANGDPLRTGPAWPNGEPPWADPPVPGPGPVSAEHPAHGSPVGQRGKQHAWEKS